MKLGVIPAMIVAAMACASCGVPVTQEPVAQQPIAEQPGSYQWAVQNLLKGDHDLDPSDPPRHVTKTDLLDVPPLPPTAKVKLAAIKYIDNLLKDPTSARYTFERPVRSIQRDRRTGDYTAGIFVCGTVNARNGFGAYTGARQFIVQFSNKYPDTIISIDFDWDNDPAAFIACTQVYNSATP